MEIFKSFFVLFRRTRSGGAKNLILERKTCRCVPQHPAASQFLVGSLISTLMRNLRTPTQQQAEQCSYFIHYKGKYAVKNGSYDDLKPQCDAITERGINATVEVTAG